MRERERTKKRSNKNKNHGLELVLEKRMLPPFFCYENIHHYTLIRPKIIQTEKKRKS